MQSVHGTKAALAGQIFKLPHNKVRVICDNMGGGFGMKGGCYPEYGLSLWASEVIGRPVRWIAERSEGADERREEPRQPCRDELALDKDGKFLALRAINNASIGAYYSTDRPTIPLTIGARLPRQHLHLPGGPRAGDGGADQHDDDRALSRRQPARADLSSPRRSSTRRRMQLGIDPAELRRRNTIPASAMPYTTAMQQIYDSGDFGKNLADALKLADHAGAEQRRAAAKKRGKLLGVGVATTVAATGGRDYEFAEIRFDPGGGVMLMTGSMDHGQGHGTTFKQVLSEKLGIDADLIRYQFGDSDLVDGDRHVRLALGAARRLARSSSPPTG